MEVEFFLVLKQEGGLFFDGGLVMGGRELGFFEGWGWLRDLGSLGERRDVGSGEEREVEGWLLGFDRVGKG